jgi:hypothetical protein
MVEAKILQAQVRAERARDDVADISKMIVAALDADSAYEKAAMIDMALASLAGVSMKFGVLVSDLGVIAGLLKQKEDPHGA